MLLSLVHGTLPTAQVEEAEGAETVELTEIMVESVAGGLAAAFCVVVFLVEVLEDFLVEVVEDFLVVVEVVFLLLVVEVFLVEVF